MFGWAEFLFDLRSVRMNKFTNTDHAGDKMNRTMTMIAILAFLGGGIAFQASADDPQSESAPAKKSCCNDAAKQAKPAAKESKDKTATKASKDAPAAKDPKATTKSQEGPLTDAPQICLQYLLYDDEVIALWSVDLFASEACADGVEAYFWTNSGKTAPQICDEGHCEMEKADGLRAAAAAVAAANAGSLEPFPAIGRSLFRESSYIDRPLIRVKNAGGEEWDPRAGLKTSGESDFVFIKLTNANTNELFAVRLSKGQAQFSKTSLSVKPNDRNIHIGFEVDMDEKDIERLPSPSAVKPWRLYPSPDGRPYRTSVFVVTVDGLDYHVTTSKNNLVRVVP